MTSRPSQIPIEVVGAGPAGLAAAITLARCGRRVLVHEAQSEVGHRFRADLQGLENWSTKRDVMEVMRDAGITTAFAKVPFTRGTGLDAWDGCHAIRSTAPLFYLVERGPRSGSLDTALLDQAHALGVDVRFGSRMEHLNGSGILAVGPKAADAIAVGYHFETNAPDGYWLLLDEHVAPRGYAYLLVMRGRGTVKTCMFAGFKQERMYVERTVERFRRVVDVEMRNPHFHGGVGNFRAPATALSGRHPVAGEQAGFQDAFAGFGMRYAILSGVMAARSILAGDDYDGRWMPALRPTIETSIVNRALYSALSNRGYRWLLRSLAWSGDARRFLRILYGPARLRRLLLPWAQRRYRSQREDTSCNHVDCTCIWCRCGVAS